MRVSPINTVSAIPAAIRRLRRVIPGTSLSAKVTASQAYSVAWAA